MGDSEAGRPALDRHERPTPPGDGAKQPPRANQHPHRAEDGPRPRPLARNHVRAGRRLDADDRQVAEHRDGPRDHHDCQAPGQRPEASQRPPLTDEGELQGGDESQAGERQRGGKDGDVARTRCGIEQSTKIEATGEDLTDRGQDDRTDTDQHRVGPPGPAAAQARARPVLPPEGDHHDERQRECDDRSEDARRPVAAEPDRQEDRDREDEQQAEQTEDGLPGRSRAGTARLRQRRTFRHPLPLAAHRVIRDRRRLDVAHCAGSAGSITSSGDIGRLRLRRPVAWKTAFAMAAAPPTWPISPTPLAPSGPTSSSFTSTKSTRTSGASALTGTRYSARLVSVQRPYRGSMWLPSRRAWLIPHSMPPISWLRASSGLSTRPGANAPFSRRTRTSPSSGSTATSANWAPNVSSPCGVSSGGGRHVPSASASDMWLRASTSRYVSAASGRSDEARRPLVPVTERGLTPYSGARPSPTASATSWSRSAVPAAWTAELTMPAPAEPTAAVLLGRSVSPALDSTSRGGTA